jgi:hypothetical protein
MTKSNLLELFKTYTDNALLRDVLLEYNISLDLPEDERVAKIFGILSENFEEYADADQNN